MPINPTTLKALIDTQITNETVNFAITPAEVGGRMKDTIDYTTEQIGASELLVNKSTNVTTDGASDTKYPSVKAIKDYVDANSGGVPKTSGFINLSVTPQVLPFDINSCAFQGGKAFLPTTTEIGKQVYVFATQDNIEIRANSAGTNFMFVKFQTFIPSVTLLNKQMYLFTYVGFGSGAGGTVGGYWLAEILEGYTAENIANKSTDVGLGTSDILYPTQNAVKTYVDANAGVSVIKNIKVTLSSAQILALNTTPIQLVPAVTGKLLVPQFLFQKYNHVSTPYTTSGLFRIGLGSITFGFAAFGAVITSADNSQGLNNFGYSQSTSGLTYQNLPLIIGATSANPTGGDGTLDLYLTYLEVTL